MTMINFIKNIWMKFSRAIGYINTRIFLTLFYILLGIPAVILMLFRKDLLDRKLNDGDSYWKEKSATTDSIEQARHQF
jgi:hypothetical protein